MGEEKTPIFTIYDTTLRDGAQKANVKFTRQEKYLIFKRLVEDLSIPFIEVYPFSNIKDRKLIELVKERVPEYLNRLVPFGSTRRSDKTVEEDANLQAIVDQITNGLEYATIFGKS